MDNRVWNCDMDIADLCLPSTDTDNLTNCQFSVIHEVNGTGEPDIICNSLQSPNLVEPSCKRVRFSDDPVGELNGVLLIEEEILDHADESIEAEKVSVSVQCTPEVSLSDTDGQFRWSFSNKLKCAVREKLSIHLSHLDCAQKKIISLKEEYNQLSGRMDCIENSTRELTKFVNERVLLPVPTTNIGQKRTLSSQAPRRVPPPTTTAISNLLTIQSDTTPYFCSLPLQSNINPVTALNNVVKGPLAPVGISVTSPSIWPAIPAVQQLQRASIIPSVPRLPVVPTLLNSTAAATLPPPLTAAATPQPSQIPFSLPNNGVCDTIDLTCEPAAPAVSSSSESNGICSNRLAPTTTSVAPTYLDVGATTNLSRIVAAETGSQLSNRVVSSLAALPTNRTIVNDGYSNASFPRAPLPNSRQSWPSGQRAFASPTVVPPPPFISGPKDTSTCRPNSVKELKSLPIAPLPLVPYHYLPGSLPVQSCPQLTIAEAAEGVCLQWSVTARSKTYERALRYEIHSYASSEVTLDSVRTCVPWKKVGQVDALPLPMACTLTHVQANNIYYFAIRSVDRFGRFSGWSNVVNAFVG